MERGVKPWRSGMAVEGRTRGNEDGQGWGGIQLSDPTTRKLRLSGPKTFERFDKRWRHFLRSSDEIVGGAAGVEYSPTTSGWLLSEPRIPDISYRGPSSAERRSNSLDDNENFNNPSPATGTLSSPFYFLSSFDHGDKPLSIPRWTRKPPGGARHLHDPPRNPRM